MNPNYKSKIQPKFKRAKSIELVENESGDYTFDEENQKNLIDNIFCGYQNKNILQVDNTLKTLGSLLCKDDYHISIKLFTDTQLLTILIDLMTQIESEDRPLRKIGFLSLQCLIVITFLTNEVSEKLVSLSFLQTLIDFIDKVSSSNIESILICLYNILYDVPSQITFLYSHYNPTHFLSLFYTEEMEPYRKYPNSLHKRISNVLSLFCRSKVMMSDKDIYHIAHLYCTYLCNESYKLFKVGLNGIQIMLENNLIKSINVNLFNDIPDILEKASEHEDEECKKLALSIISEMYNISYFYLKFDIRDIFDECIKNLNNEIGLYSYNAVYSILKNTEESKVEEFLLCDHVDFVDQVLLDGIIDGPFAIMWLANLALLKTLKESGEYILRFASMKFFCAVEKLLLTDDEEIISRILECLYIFFFRCKCINMDCFNECIEMINQTSLVELLEKNSSSNNETIAGNCTSILNLMFK